MTQSRKEENEKNDDAGKSTLRVGQQAEKPDLTNRNWVVSQLKRNT